MAAPLGSNGSGGRRPARRRGAGAAAGAADPGRRRRLAALLLLAVLIVAGAVTAIVTAVTGSHHSTSAGSRHPAAAGAASAQATGSASASAAGSTSAAPVFGLVGGGGIAPRTAAGGLAVTGSLGDVLFAEDGAALDHDARQVIATAAQAIHGKHAGTVTVIGYTDAIGNASANQQLSLQRARAVVTALRADLGGTAVAYSAEARGQSKPVAVNSTASGRQLNRRVVITAP